MQRTWRPHLSFQSKCALRTSHRPSCARAPTEPVLSTPLPILASSVVDFCKKTYTELAPGTRIRQRDLHATIAKTVWEGKSEGIDCAGDEMWEEDPISRKRMPAYLLQFTSDSEVSSSELVLCCEVHDVRGSDPNPSPS